MLMNRKNSLSGLGAVVDNCPEVITDPMVGGNPAEQTIIHYFFFYHVKIVYKEIFADILKQVLLVKSKDTAPSPHPEGVIIHVSKDA
jgi:hypothetical protein